MLFPENFFQTLPSDLIKSLQVFLKYFNDNHLFEEDVNRLNQELYEQYIEAYVAACTFIKAYNLSSNFQIQELGHSRGDNINYVINLYIQIGTFVRASEQQDLIESLRFKYQTQLNLVFAYSLTDGDLQKVQNYINELRNMITVSELFSENHRQRLLKRLEELQGELHKKMSNLDKFWGLFGEAGIVLGKFGNDAKPFFDLVINVMKIIWNSQTAANELPSGTSLPMLQ
jgi:hypothetical protein